MPGGSSDRGTEKALEPTRFQSPMPGLFRPWTPVGSPPRYTVSILDAGAALPTLLVINSALVVMFQPSMPGFFTSWPPPGDPHRPGFNPSMPGRLLRADCWCAPHVAAVVSIPRCRGALQTQNPDWWTEEIQGFNPRCRGGSSDTDGGSSSNRGCGFQSLDAGALFRREEPTRETATPEGFNPLDAGAFQTT